MSTESQTSTPKQQETAHTKDVAYMAKVMLQQANDRGLGNEFLEMVNKLNENLDVKLPVPTLQQEATWTISFKIKAPEGANLDTGTGRRAALKDVYEAGHESVLEFLQANSTGMYNTNFDIYSVDSGRARWVFPTESAEAGTEVSA